MPVPGAHNLFAFESPTSPIPKNPSTAVPALRGGCIHPGIEYTQQRFSDRSLPPPCASSRAARYTVRWAWFV